MNYDNGTIEITINSDTFETKNRALEQYLYSHRIKPRKWFKDENSLTVWEYKVTPLLISTIERFMYITLFGTGWDARRY